LKVEIERRSYVDVENPKTGEIRRGDFKYRADFCSSVAFWYQRTVANLFKPFPPLKERVMPEVWVEPREMAELPEWKSPLRASPGLKPVSKSNRTCWQKKAFYMFNDKVGSWLEIPAKVELAGRYSISVFQLLFREHGIWKLTLAGPDLEKVLDPRMDFYDPYLAWKEDYPENEVFGTVKEKKVGIFNLKPGNYIFRFESVGTHPLSIDDKTGNHGFSIGLDAISLRKLPWDDMNAWYDDYLIKEERLFEQRITEARKTVAELVKAIDAYKKDHGLYPRSLEMLIERPSDMNMSWETAGGKWPYFKAARIPLDPWGQPYQYLVPGIFNPRSFDTWSWHGNSRNPKLWIGNWEAPQKEKEKN
jgi:general secretion pathway protein G